MCGARRTYPPSPFEAVDEDLVLATPGWDYKRLQRLAAYILKYEHQPDVDNEIISLEELQRREYTRVEKDDENNDD